MADQEEREHDGGLTVAEAKAIADGVMGAARHREDREDREVEAEVNAAALAAFILRGD